MVVIIYCKLGQELSTVRVLVTRSLTEAAERLCAAWAAELGPEVVSWWCVVWVQHMCG